jgi:hypothetical protein
MRLVFPTPGVACLAAALAFSIVPLSDAAGQTRESPVDLVQTQLNVPGKIKIGKKFRVMDEVESVGDMPAGFTITYFYLSKDDAVDSTDLVIAQRRSPQLSPGRSSFEPTQVVLPGTVEPGAYYLIARCNATRAVDERYWDNNTRAVKVVVEPAEAKK